MNLKAESGRGGLEELFLYNMLLVLPSFTEITPRMKIVGGEVFFLFIKHIGPKLGIWGTPPKLPPQ